MVFKTIFGKEVEGREEEFVEIEPTGEEKRKVSVRIEDLNDYRDVEALQKLVREGNIVFLKMKSLREKDLGELKRSVQRLRKTSTAMGGDIVGVDENFLVICPQFARVHRGSPEKVQV